MARTGRRPGAGGTRERILAAARSHFARVGYEGATIRGIAAAAEVDPKLVLHYFESKEGVFIAAVEFPFDPSAAIPRLLEPGLNGLGARLVRFFIETWESPAGSPMLALIRSVVSSESAAKQLRDFVSRAVLARSRCVWSAVCVMVQGARPRKTYVSSAAWARPSHRPQRKPGRILRA